MDDVTIPKVTKVGPHRFPHKDWRGRPKGEKLKYRWKKRPYAHQVLAVKKLLSTGFGGALLMEPRTGKTKVAIDYMSILHTAGKVSRVVVFCPLGVMGVWEEQLEDNCPFPYRLTVWDKDGRKEQEKLPKFGKDILDIVLINYDALSQPGAIIRHDKAGNAVRSRSRGGRFTIKKKLIRWQPQLIILDESHRIKTSTAKKSTAIHSLSKVADYRVIMTGTVVTKKKRIFDIYSQWKFLNPERFPGTLSTFKSTFGIWKPIPDQNWSKFLGPANEELLHTLIHSDSYSIRRDECYDLPRRTEQILHVDLEESGEVYDQMAEDMVARIRNGEITEASIKLVQGLRLRQITSGLARTSPSRDYPEGRLIAIGSEKLRVLQDRLEDLLEADEKVVIGATWRGDLLRIEKLVKKLGAPIYVVKGGVKKIDREYARQQFKAVEGGAVFLGQPSASSEGIDLSSASIMIWYSLTNSWVHFTQFEDRIALSERPTFYEYLLARNTADEVLYESLLEDEDFGKKMITSPERLLRDYKH